MIGIISEPKDTTYFKLLEYLGHSCDMFTLTMHDNVRRFYTAPNVLTELESYLIDIVHEKDMFYFGYSEANVYIYRLTSESLNILKRACSRLYQWRHPDLPEDLCFLDAEYKIRFSSIAHEEISLIKVDNEYEVSYLNEDIGLTLYLDDSAPMTPIMDGIFNIQENHLLECARLYERVFNAEPWLDSWTEASAYKRLHDIYSTPGFYGLVYITGGKIVGAVFGNLEKWYEGQHYNIKEMFVSTEQQGEGMGTKLMNKLTSELQAREVNTVILFTSRGNNTHRFYQKCGFHELESMAMMAKEL